MVLAGAEKERHRVLGKLLSLFVMLKRSEKYKAE